MFSVCLQLSVSVLLSVCLQDNVCAAVCMADGRRVCVDKCDVCSIDLVDCSRGSRLN